MLIFRVRRIGKRFDVLDLAPFHALPHRKRDLGGRVAVVIIAHQTAQQPRLADADGMRIEIDSVQAPFIDEAVVHNRVERMQPLDDSHVAVAERDWRIIVGTLFQH